MWRTLFVLWLIIAACGSPSNLSRTSSVRDSSGVQIVTSNEPGWQANTAWQVDTVPVTSIGGDESDQQQQFTYVPAATRMPNSEVVVAMDDELKWFGPDGKYLRTMSRAGQGPGEFRAILSLARIAGDTLMVSGDVLAEKVAMFSPDGHFLRESRLDREKWDRRGHWMECQLGVLPDGSRFDCQEDPSIPKSATNRILVPRNASPGLLRQLYRFYVVPPALDTAYPLGIASGLEQFLVKGPGGRAVGSVLHPFYGRGFIAAGGQPLRIALATNPAYNIEIWTPQGRLERIIRRANGRRAPTEQEKTAVLGPTRERYQRQHPDATADQVNEAIAQVPMPDSLPAVVGLVVGPGGEVLVQREGWLPSQRASVFDIFDANGQWRGVLRLPPRMRVFELGANYLLGMRTDQDDVIRVEVYLLRK